MIIKIYKNVFEQVSPEIFETNSLEEFLYYRYGEQPLNPIELFVGEPDPSRCITGNVEYIFRVAKMEEEAVKKGVTLTFSIIERTGTTIPLFVLIAVQLFVTALVSSLAQQPGNADRKQLSPNNSLGDRGNDKRILQRIEDIVGTVQSFPSLLMPTWSYYDTNGNKFERGAYCIGVGYYDGATIRDTVSDATTPYSTLPTVSESSFRISMFDPYTIPTGSSGNSVFDMGGGIFDVLDTRIKNKTATDVNMPAHNQLDFVNSSLYAFDTNKITQFPTYPLNNPNFDTVFDTGQNITITMDDTDYTPRDINDQLCTFTASTKTIVDTTSSGIFNTLVHSDTIKITSTTNTGTYTVNVVTLTGTPQITVLETIIAAIAEATHLVIVVNYSGTYEVSSVDTLMWNVMGGFYAAGSFGFPVGWEYRYDSGFYSNVSMQTLTLIGTPFKYRIMAETDDALVPVTAIISLDGAPTSEWTPWFQLAVAGQTKVMISIACPQGLYQSDSAGLVGLALDTEFEIQQLVGGTPTGTIYVVDLLIRHNSVANWPTGATLEVDLMATCGFVGSCQIRGRRTSDHSLNFQGTLADSIELEALWSIVPNTKTDLGYLTMLYTDTKLNQFASSAQTRILNCIAPRLLPTYNGTSWSAVFNADGTVASGTLHSTSSPLDIIAYLIQDPYIGNRTLAEVDVDQIYQIVEDIKDWNPDCAQFNYTFDSDTISCEDSIQMVANACFCTAYRSSNKLRLSFDRPQADDTAIVTHRSKQPGAVDTVSRSFFQSSDFDGIQMTYTDPDTKKVETFFLPLDGSYSHVKNIEVPGIRNFTQAWMRANREYRRLFNTRITIETSMTMEARSFVPNSRVGIEDNTQFLTYSGEVVGYSRTSLLMTLSNDVVFVSGHTYNIALAQRDGTPDVISCTAGPTSNQIILARAPLQAPVLIGGIDGIRTVYSFCDVDTRSLNSYRIQKVDYSSPPYVKVTAVNYSDDDYAADFETVPARVDVIGA